MKFKPISEMNFSENDLNNFTSTFSKVDRAVYSLGDFKLKGHPCHANLGNYFYSSAGLPTTVINCLEPCFSETRKGLKEFLEETYFADDSPWKDLFEHMELFEYNNRIFYYFYNSKPSNYILRMLLNFSIALRALSEGDSKYKCDTESHKFGFENIKHLMKTYDLNWRQAALATRAISSDGQIRKSHYGITLWKDLRQVHTINHHFIPGVFSKAFLRGVPLLSPKVNHFSSSGNDLLIWGVEYPFAEFEENKKSTLFTNFSRITLLPVNTNWTVENVVKYLKGEFENEQTKAA